MDLAPEAPRRDRRASTPRTDGRRDQRGADPGRGANSPEPGAEREHRKPAGIAQAKGQVTRTTEFVADGLSRARKVNESTLTE